MFFRQIQIYHDKGGFSATVNTFWVMQNNKTVTNAMYEFDKQRKVTSISIFDFSTLYTKLPHNKLLMVLTSFIDFCFDGGVSKYITINSCWVCWVKISNKP